MKKIRTFVALFFLPFAAIASVMFALSTSRNLLSIQSTTTQDIGFIPPRLSFRMMLPFDITINHLYIRATNDMLDELQQELELEQRMKELNQTMKQQHDAWNVLDREDGGFYIVSPESPSLESVKSVLNVLKEYIDSDEPHLAVNVDAGSSMEQVRNACKNLLVVIKVLDEMTGRSSGYNSTTSVYAKVDDCDTISCLDKTVRSDKISLVASTKTRIQVRFKIWITDLDDSVIAWIQLLHGIVNESLKGHVLDVQEEELSLDRAWSLLFHKLLPNETTLHTFFQMKLARKQQDALLHHQQLNSQWESIFHTILQHDELRAWFDSHLKPGSLVASADKADGEYLALLKRLKNDPELLRLFERCHSERKLDYPSNASVWKSKSLTRHQLADYAKDDMLSFGIEVSYLYPTNYEWLDSFQARLVNMIQLQEIQTALGRAGIPNMIFRSMMSLKRQSTLNAWKLAQEHEGFELVSPLNPSFKSVEAALDVMKALGVRNDPHTTALHVSVDARNKTVEQIGNVFKNFIVVEKALDEVRDPLHRAGQSDRTASIAGVFASVEQAYSLLDACQSVACLEKTAEPTKSTWYPLYIMCLRVKDDSVVPNFEKLDNLRFEFRGMRSTTQSNVAVGWIHLLNRIVQESFRGRVLEARERTVDEAWSALFDTLLHDDTLRQFFEEQRILIHNDTQNQIAMMNSRWIALFDEILGDAHVRASFDCLLEDNQGAAARTVETEYSTLLLRLQQDSELRMLFDLSRSKFPGYG